MMLICSAAEGTFGRGHCACRPGMSPAGATGDATKRPTARGGRPPLSSEFSLIQRWHRWSKCASQVCEAQENHWAFDGRLRLGIFQFVEFDVKSELGQGSGIPDSRSRTASCLRLNIMGPHLLNRLSMITAFYMLTLGAQSETNGVSLCCCHSL